MSDVKAQSVKNGVLRPSGNGAARRRVARVVEGVDTSDEAMLALIERGVQPMSAAQRNVWIMDAVTFLLTVYAKDRASAE